MLLVLVAGEAGVSEPGACEGIRIPVAHRHPLNPLVVCWVRDRAWTHRLHWFRFLCNGLFPTHLSYIILGNFLFTASPVPLVLLTLPPSTLESQTFGRLLPSGPLGTGAVHFYARERCFSLCVVVSSCPIVFPPPSRASKPGVLRNRLCVVIV